MTLFLQLVTTAAVIPFAMIAVQTARLGIIGKDPDGYLWEIAHNPHFWVGPPKTDARNGPV